MTNNIKEAIETLRQAETALALAKKNLSTSIDKTIVKRFFAFLQENRTYGYIPMNFLDYAYTKENPGPMDPFEIPKAYKSTDFKFDLRQSGKESIRFTRKQSVSAFSADQYFDIPLDYFDNPKKWEKKMLKTITTDVKNAKGILYARFPDLEGLVKNGQNELFFTKEEVRFKNMPETKTRLLIKVDATPLHGEQAVNMPFTYNGAVYGQTNITLAYDYIGNIVYSDIGYRGIVYTEFPLTDTTINFMEQLAKAKANASDSE